MASCFCCSSIFHSVSEVCQCLCSALQVLSGTKQAGHITASPFSFDSSFEQRICRSGEHIMSFSQTLLSWVPSLHLSGPQEFLSLQPSCGSFCSPPLLWGRKQEFIFKNRVRHSHNTAHEQPIQSNRSWSKHYCQQSMRKPSGSPQIQQDSSPQVTRYSYGLRWKTIGKDLGWNSYCNHWKHNCSTIITQLMQSSQTDLAYFCAVKKT